MDELMGGAPAGEKQLQRIPPALVVLHGAHAGIIAGKGYLLIRRYVSRILSMMT